MSIERLLAQNLAEVRGRIDEAARKAGRDSGKIALVVVTKYVDACVTQDILAAGAAHLGESRPQQLWAKAAALEGAPVAWHLIGSLQRNKVRRTLEVVHLIHSLDSARLADAIQTEAQMLERTINVLVEVNISGDATKHGVAPDEVEPLLAHAAALSNVRVRGLMTMSHRAGGPDVARQDFARLRELRDQLRPDSPAAVSLDELSMGMSDDFEQAILEGATIVRVGSALFRGITPQNGC